MENFFHFMKSEKGEGLGCVRDARGNFLREEIKLNFFFIT